MTDALDHLHHTRQVYDMTTLGRALARAVNEAAARNLLHLGTAAIWDVPETGNASTSQVVIGTDTRLTDARTPVGTALAYAKLWVGDIDGEAAAVDMSGDATISGSGVVGLKSNVARKDSDNAFSAAQTITGSAPSSVSAGQVAIGGGSFLATGHAAIGSQAVKNDDWVLLLKDTYAGAASVYRGLRIETTHPGIAASASTGIDVIHASSGANNMDHTAGVQSRPTHQGSGTLTYCYGVWATVNAYAGTISNAYGLYAAANTNTSGTTAKSYGLYLEAQTNGSSENWSIYSLGKAYIGPSVLETDSQLRVGGLEMQYFGANNGWLADNVFYDSGWKYRSTGRGRLVRMDDGSGNFNVTRFASGSAGGAATPIIDFKIADNGTAFIDGAAPSSVSAGQVAIGGGEAIAATSINCANKVRMTPEGGIAIRITNKSGATSVKGRLVQLSGVSQDNAYTIASADSFACVGAEYESGIADGSECWVVVSGIAEVLLADSTASTRGYWVKVSDSVAGRADATNAFPPGGTITALEDHSSEIGHALESKTAGTSVLAKISMHFN